MTIRAVIFDLGHTLWDIQPLDPAALDAAYALAHARLLTRFEGHAVPVPSPRQLRDAVSDVLHEFSETYFAGATQLEQPPTHWFVDQAWRRLGLELPEPLLRELTPPLFAGERVVSDGGRDALQRLQEDGYLLGCITNTLADSSTIRRALAEAGLLEMMGVVVVSSEEGWRKPHPSLFVKALNALGADAGRAVFVGDSPWHDIAGAKAVGMRAVLTRQYAARPAAGDLAKADAVIDHIRELPETVERLRTLSEDVRQRPAPAG